MTNLQELQALQHVKQRPGIERKRRWEGISVKFKLLSNLTNTLSEIHPTILSVTVNCCQRKHLLIPERGCPSSVTYIFFSHPTTVSTITKAIQDMRHSSTQLSGYQSWCCSSSVGICSEESWGWGSVHLSLLPQHAACWQSFPWANSIHVDSAEYSWWLFFHPQHFPLFQKLLSSGEAVSPFPHNLAAFGKTGLLPLYILFTYN